MHEAFGITQIINLIIRFALGSGQKPYCDIPANTYCGGNFKGIENNLDYIKGMGFDAIWISPIVANYPRNFHGYAAQNIYQINPYFGTVEEFLSLVKACKANGRIPYLTFIRVFFFYFVF